MNHDQQEARRLLRLNQYENAAREQGYRFIAGVDEAGRGPLAGPVVAAACFIPEGVSFPGVNDSKQLSEKAREKLFAEITSHEQVIYGVGIVDPEEIDKINILQAAIKAMVQSIANMPQQPDYLLVDGLQLPHAIPVLKIIQGDAKSQSIAAASIIAKVLRDRMMLEYHQKWPSYCFNRNKGYGTEQHREMIEKLGPCPIHRMTFEPLKTLFSKNSIKSLN